MNTTGSWQAGVRQMGRTLTQCETIERSIIKKYREELWAPFITAVQRYDLIQEGDRIAVCMSGGKDSFLMAKLMQEVNRHGKVPFEARYLVMDPGYSSENRRKIEQNAALLRIPVEIFESSIFEIADSQEKSPCYLCARMRRGALYAKAKEIGCNKIALGHHLDDVIETTLLGMFYASQLQGMMPKLHSSNFPGMELIRPLYCVREEDILSWAHYNHLAFIQCACRFTENAAVKRDGPEMSKRKEIKEMIRCLEKENPDLKQSLFNSIHSVCTDTFPGFKSGGQRHSFLENYGQETKEEEL